MEVVNLLYQYDLMGINDNNIIKGERHSITQQNGDRGAILIPYAAPYFAKDLVVYHVQSGELLSPDTDYYCTNLFTEHALCVPPYNRVYGGIGLKDLTIKGDFLLSYRTLGGEFTINKERAMNIALRAIEMQGGDWNDIVDVPTVFNPEIHGHNIMSITVGMKEVAEALLKINNSIIESTLNEVSSLEDINKAKEIMTNQLQQQNAAINQSIILLSNKIDEYLRNETAKRIADATNINSKLAVIEEILFPASYTDVENFKNLVARYRLLPKIPSLDH